jgi:hypothetical protein
MAKETKQERRVRKARLLKLKKSYNRWYRRLFRWLKGLFL